MNGLYLKQIRGYCSRKAKMVSLWVGLLEQRCTAPSIRLVGPAADYNAKQSRLSVVTNYLDQTCCHSAVQNLNSPYNQASFHIVTQQFTLSIDQAIDCMITDHDYLIFVWCYYGLHPLPKYQHLHAQLITAGPASICSAHENPLKAPHADHSGVHCSSTPPQEEHKDSQTKFLWD